MCGIFGIFNHDDAATITALGLHSLQHRGQEACGIVTHNKNNFYLNGFTSTINKKFKSNYKFHRSKMSNIELFWLTKERINKIY